MKAIKLNTKPLNKTKRSVSANRNTSIKKHNDNIKQHHQQQQQQCNDNDICSITTTTIKKSKSLSKNTSPIRNNKLHSRKHSSRTSSPGITVYKVLQNAKDLLTIQTSIIEQCDTLNKQLSQTELELNAKLNTNKTHFSSLSNTLHKVKESNTKCEQCEQFNSFMLVQLNSVNELIGKLGYNYVFHKFKTHNFTMENIATYFANVKQLLISLNEENAKLQSTINKYNNNNNTNTNNEQYSFNKNVNNVNAINTQQTNITTLPCVTNIKDEYNGNNNIYTNESSMNMNFFCSGGGMFNRNSSSNSNDNNKEMKAEMDNKSYINNNNNKNNADVLLSQSSNLFDSGTFFAEYKRNKEIRNELELLYTEGNNSNLVSKNYEEFRIVPNENHLCNTQTNYNNTNNYHHSNTLGPKQSNKLFFN
jgi:hypothetical protein